MAKDFGKTWWGEHWLRSLDNIDYDNRLPRGASYARNGKVKEVKIKDNQINSKVSGSRPTPYKVTIIVPPFFEDQVAPLMDKIIATPMLISKLLNRELDPEILTIAENLGLKVFPKQWTDFKMQCSCPDWAVPCKHLASVIYMVSREIDNNPFMVFEIHNVNLIEELKKRGIHIADNKKNEIPLLSQLLAVKINNKTTDFVEENAYRKIDFKTLQPIAETLLQIVPDAPAFYPYGNFREKYAFTFNRVVKDANRIFKKNIDFDSLFAKVKIVPDRLNHHSIIQLSEYANANITITGEQCKYKSLDELTVDLWHLNPDHLADYQPSVAGLQKLLIASLHLIANGAITPQIVQLDTKSFAIRWLPATIDINVKALIEKLSNIVPPSLLLTKQIIRKKESVVEVENSIVETLSIFVTQLISKIYSGKADDLFFEMFFNQKQYAFNGVGENAQSGGIKVWLDRYYIATDNYKPIITITEIDEDNFKVNFSIEDSNKSDALPIELSNILSQKQYETQRFKILQTLSLLSPFVPGLDTHINTMCKSEIVFNNKGFAPFLTDALPVIRMFGIKTMIPKSLQTLLRPKASLRLKKSSKEGSFIQLRDLFSFDWQIAIGDTVMSPEEYKKLTRDAAKLIRFKGSYIYVNDSDLEQIQKHFLGTKNLNSFQLLQSALTEEYEGAPIILSDEIRDMIKELTSTENIPLPNGINATLRPYQERGYSWLYRNSKIGFGSIIADDMGLGKTIQVISTLLKFKEDGILNAKHKALVVSPTGLLTNWLAEIERFAPSLTAAIYHGTTRSTDKWAADVMLTTYGTARNDAEMLKKMKWQVMIIDEAQNIKNYDTAQSKAIKSIPAEIRIAMSGTPVENRLSEFWSIMDYANKGYLGNAKEFNNEFGQPIQMFGDEMAVTKFRKVTAPFMMRRLKSDKTIISDLPDKIETNQYSTLTKAQSVLYEKTLNEAMNEIEGITASDLESLFKRQGLVLQMILALKQICNHPTQFLKNGKFDASLSGKTEMLLDILETIVERNEKVLIFTQFTEMGEMLKRFITEKFKEEPMFYHGSCSLNQRTDMVERFQHNRADKIFLLSLKAAGTGLNLTAATHVIHYDLWWNPAVEAQATDRAYRIGQKNNVQVHRFITKNTFEEKIDAMIQKKKQLADMTVTTGENWIGKLSNKELRDLFK